MKRIISIVGLIILVWALCGPAWSAMIVDTGVPPDHDYGTVLSPGQWSAGRFTISESSTISAMRGYIGGGSGAINIAIYNDANRTYQGETSGHVPLYSFAAPLFTESFLAVSDWSWQGASGLHRVLNPGTYWIAFQVPGGFIGYISGLTNNAPPHPMAAYYATVNQGTTWWPTINGVAAIQIEAAAPVPLPAAILLFAPGLAGLAIVRRRFKE